jgi:hypothetical protein
MANITFPESPSNGQKIVIGNKVYIYNSTTSSWRAARFSAAGRSEVPVTGAALTSNITFPASAANGEKIVVGNTVYSYSNSTGVWSKSKFLAQGKLQDTTTDTDPEITLSVDSITLSAGEPFDLTFSVTDSDNDLIVAKSVATGSLEDANVVIYKANNTIRITAGSTDITSGTLGVTVTDGRNTVSKSANVSFASYVFQGSSTGYVSGGDPLANQILKFSFASSPISFTDVGDLTTPMIFTAGQKSATHGYSNKLLVNNKYPYSSDTNATLVGNMATSAEKRAGQSSSENGYAAGGGPPTLSDIDKFPFATDTNATDIGDLATAVQNLGGVGGSSETDGFILGGLVASVPVGATTSVQKFPFATDSNAAGYATLSEKKHSVAGVSSSTFLYAVGGAKFSPPPPSYIIQNVIEKFPFSSPAPRTDVGDLGRTTWVAAGVSSTTDGYSVGGSSPIFPFPSLITTVQKFPYSSDTNSSDVGNLDVVKSLMASSQI